MNDRKLKKTELEKLKKIELEILLEFDKICRKHNLKYILCGGTLIGAVRHNGFIPWDDDIDISMLREDYEKFVKIQDKELNKKKYYFQSMDNEDKCVTISSKIRRKDSIYAESLSNLDIEKQGIWIDIFPVDNISDNQLIAKIHMFKVIIMKILISFKNDNTAISKSKIKSIILEILKFCAIFTNKDKLKQKIKSNINKYNNKNTKNVGCFGGCYLFKEILKKEYFEDVIEHKFENHNFYIPKKYDEYLRNFYGDYMKLPPIEKQKSNHYICELKFPKEK